MTTPEQDHKVLHASGLTNSKTVYRKHYCDRADEPDLLELVKVGLMTGPHDSKLLHASHAYFYLTEAGVQHAKALAKVKK